MKITNIIKNSFLILMALDGSQGASAMEGQQEYTPFGGITHPIENVFAHPYYTSVAANPIQDSQKDLYNLCEETVNSFVTKGIQRSLDQGESFSWLFEEKFRKRYFKEINAFSHKVINRLYNDGHFFHQLLELMTSDKASPALYEEFLKSRKFHDLSDLQDRNSKAHQLVYLHESGLLIRVKTSLLRPTICLSLYNNASLNHLISYINNPNEQMAQRVAQVFWGKCKNEVCKIYLQRFLDGRFIIAPVPHTPPAVVSLRDILKQAGIRPTALRADQYNRLQTLWKDKVMDMGHMSITLTDNWTASMRAFSELSPAMHVDTYNIDSYGDEDDIIMANALYESLGL